MRLAEIYDEDTTIERIIGEVTRGITCQEYGVCVYLAYELTKAMLRAGIRDFVVKEGWVEAGYPEPFAHTWIEMSDGREIDPSFPEVFGSNASKTADIQAVFRPREFLEYAEEDMGF